MKITLEIDFGKEFDNIPLNVAHDALVGLEVRLRRDMIYLWQKKLSVVNPLITYMEISNVIDPHSNL